jgi:hypothetical protein
MSSLMLVDPSLVIGWCIRSMRHVSSSSQAYEFAQDYWFNDRLARANYPNRKEFAEAVRTAFESA